MITYDDLKHLLTTTPFVPFRLHLSDGGSVEVRHRDFVTAGRRYALVRMLDLANPHGPFDKHTVVWYLHVTRAEMLAPGPPPAGFSSPPGETSSPSGAGS